MGDTVSPRRTKKRKEPTGFDRAIGGLQVASEALNLVRTAPPATLVAYYIGSVPCILGLLYFVSDMSRSAFARERCFTLSLVMAGLFLWMKAWHAVFAASLRDRLMETQAPWTTRRAMRLVATQVALQPYGLVLIPVSILLLIPFHAVYSFYQNVTVLGNGRSSNAGTVRRDAWNLSKLWPVQNHVLIWLLSPSVLAVGLLGMFASARLLVSLTPELYEMHGFFWLFLGLLVIFYVMLLMAPFACAVAGNVAAILIMLPAALRSFFGIQTVFTLSGWHAIFNTTFLSAVLAISYLCLDPIIKAAYVLRCYYGKSRRTGEDLASELRRESGGRSE